MEESIKDDIRFEDRFKNLNSRRKSETRGYTGQKVIHFLLLVLPRLGVDEEFFDLFLKPDWQIKVFHSSIDCIEQLLESNRVLVHLSS